MPKNIIGGEYLFHQNMFDEPYLVSVLDTAHQHHPGYHHHLTGGGYFSLKAILKHLITRNRTGLPILLPSYLCPSILKPLCELGIDYTFYPVGETLQPDIPATEALITDPLRQAILVIPYFGFGFSGELHRFYRKLRMAGVTVIEDRAQCLFPAFEPVGNFIFYSFRKFMPADGSLLLSDEDMEIHFDHYNETYIILKRAAREQRYNFIHHGTGDEKSFLTALQNAEMAYYSEGIAGFEMTNLALFTRMNIPYEIAHRKEVYKLLHQMIGDIKVIRDPYIESSSPLCFPIRVNNRNKLSDILKREKIFAPVHWRITKDEVPAVFSKSHELAASIISLPVRSNMTEEDCIRVSTIVNKFVSE